MKAEKIWVLSFVVFGGLSLSGCGQYSQTIKLYSGPELPQDKVATFLIPYNNTELIVDGKFVEWHRLGPGPPYDETIIGTTNVRVNLMPGPHSIEWSMSKSNLSWTYHGSGTLETKPGAIYNIHFAYLPMKGQSRPYEGLYHLKVQDYATWVTDKKTGEVVIGEKPTWAK